MSVGIIYAATTIGTNISTTGNTTLGDTNADTITLNGQIVAATTTGNLVVGIDTLGAPTSTLSVYGTLHVFRGTATSSDALWVGSAGTVNNLSLSGGDLYVQDGLEVDGGSWLNSATTTDSLVIGGNATSTGRLAVGSESTAATTTVQIKADAVAGNGSSCIEMVNVEGVIYKIYINGAGVVTAAAGTCI